MATEFGWYRRWRARCPRCHGRGTVEVAGERYTREELRRPEMASTYGDILVNGGWAAPALRVDCPRCDGSGRRGAGRGGREEHLVLKERAAAARAIDWAERQDRR